MISVAQNLSRPYFRHKAIQDLWWALISPPLFSYPIPPHIWIDNNWPGTNQEEIFHHLNKLDNDLSLLPIPLRKLQYRRLGYYFEDLIALWISSFPPYSLIAKNLIITSGKQQLGEIDFIFHCARTEKYYHLETAVKFYLNHQNNSDWDTWLGPNPIDVLGNKMRKLTQKQVKLSDHPEALNALKDLQVYEHQAAILMKGRLYQHKSSTIMPRQVHSEYLRGHWVYKREWKEEPIDQRIKFCILPRLFWMGTCQEIFKQMDLLSRDELDQIIMEKRKPLHICSVDQIQQKEINRFFIVPDSWPLKSGNRNL